MSGKFKKGLMVDLGTDDPIRRPRPVSQDGYYYPEEHNVHPEPPRQWGSSASLEVRTNYIRQQKEQEFFSTTVTPTSPNLQSSYVSNEKVVDKVEVKEIEEEKKGRKRVESEYDITDYYRDSFIPPPSSTFENKLPPSPSLYPQQQVSNQFKPLSTQASRSVPNSSIKGQIMQPPARQSSLDSVGSAEYLPKNDYSHNSITLMPPTPRNYTNEPITISSSASSPNQMSPYQLSPNQTSPYQLSPNQLSPNQLSPNQFSIARELAAMGPPVTAEDYVMQGIKYHEDDQLEKSTEYLRIAAEQNNAIGIVLYGIALRHGWGCKPDARKAFKYLQMAAESAMNIINNINKTLSMSSFKGELVLAIYELGVCFRHGWGVPKNAQNDIALCYYKGEGVKKDMKAGHGTLGNSWIFKEKYNE
ncbi:1381_t:CDS:2 [Diversispora eburnea]|uniref:1381_t:CDS:1 n=1 Tax=Diversispora eburnea TaxID=1213867 RepID=A0A9N9GB84_9GLOM|nr:1381_t:CDS:2 [Diversispora eburnea]